MATIDVFQSHELLLYELDEDIYYDLFLFDIEMKNGSMNGMETAKRIRGKKQECNHYIHHIPYEIYFRCF